MDVSAILNAVYRRPEPLAQSLSERVRARLSLFETVAECVRLLASAPLSALAATVSPTARRDGAETSGHD